MFIDKGMTLDEAHQAHQAGVKLDLELEGITTNAPIGRVMKFLRVGLDNSLCYQGALAKLLERKGIITMAEYVEEMRLLANNEVASYEARLSEKIKATDPQCATVVVTLHAGPEPFTGKGAGYVSIDKR